MNSKLKIKNSKCFYKIANNLFNEIKNKHKLKSTLSIYSK